MWNFVGVKREAAMHVYQLQVKGGSSVMVASWVANCTQFGMAVTFMTPKLKAVAPSAAESQEPLLAFLKAVLKLSFALLGNARPTSGRSQPALTAVRQILPVICSLEGSVEDPKSRAVIHNRAIDLKFALDAFVMFAG
jgi:hypothetical protein